MTNARLLPTLPSLAPGMALAVVLLVADPAHSVGDSAAQGVAFLASGQVNEARQAFAVALSQDPSRSVAVAGLAAAHLLAGEGDKSLTSFATAAQLAPESAWPEACLGAAYLARGDDGQAAECFGRALARRPDWAAVRARLAYALYRRKLLSAALETANAARAQGDQVFAPLVEAAALIELGDPSQAFAVLAGFRHPANEAVSMSPLLPSPIAYASATVTAAAATTAVASTEETPAPGAIRFVWPRMGARLSGRVEVQVTADTPVDYVVIYVDDQFLAVSNVVTFRTIWESWKWPDGVHRLRVESHDTAGRCSGRQEIEVLVANRARTTDAARNSRDALLGLQLAEICLPQLPPHEAYVLRARAASALNRWSDALDSAEGAFCFWPWEPDVRRVVSDTYRALGVSRAEAQELHVLHSRREIAITFDDGPHPRLTPFLLRVLAQRGIRATFFLVGKQALLYPELVRDILTAGHELGSHSYSHQNMAKMSLLDVERELVQSRWALAQACGRRVVLFRPPGGHYSEAVRRAAAAYGFRPVFWTANISRYSGDPLPQVVQGLYADLQGGGIVLLHNGDDETPRVVEELLDRLIAAGYRLGPVGEMSGVPDPYFAVASPVGG